MPDERREPATTTRRTTERARRAARLWGELTLGGIALVGGLTIWHLRRRARLLHDRARPPRRVSWPELETEIDPVQDTDRDEDRRAP
jgi:hypothetical protein